MNNEIINNIKPLIAIIGRPNVGKSTFFNQILGKNAAIIDDMPGVTRDLHYEDITYIDKPFTLIDTGGFHIDEEGDVITMGIKDQIQTILGSVDGVILLVDTKLGLHPSDAEIFRLIQRMGIRHWIVGSKVDDASKEIWTSEFYEMGIDEIFPVSGKTGYGVYDFLDTLTADFWTQKEIDEKLPPEEEEIKIAVIGRPNVGKSTLVNRLIGEEKMLVSPVAGTTMDPIDTVFHYKEQKFRVIDTAGIRKKKKIDMLMEKAAVVRAFRSVDRADIVLFLMDANELATEQDLRILGLAHDKHKGIVIIVNKWDTIEKDPKTFDNMVLDLRYQIKFAPYAPIISISAIEGQRIPKLLDKVIEIHKNYNKRVSNQDIRDWLEESLRKNPPPLTKKKHIPIYFRSASMEDVAPPTLVFRVNKPKEIHFSYQRYLANRFYKRFGYEGIPIRFVFASTKAGEEQVNTER